MQYRYDGPQPVQDETGELVHPGDVRELIAGPDCPPWLPLDGESEPGAADAAPGSPASPAPFTVPAVTSPAEM